ncbi:MAG TPA: hypothetical protein VEB61_00075 [Candidatus Binatia bacterium]|nr:hypothetical protein [Candidatus Binatia bacterium]
MIGDPAEFEAIGNRLGFHIFEDTPEKIVLRWQGARFPAFLCLGIALLLLFVSIPISQALWLRGFVGPAGSLWYFPLMNLVLFGIAIFLVTQRRTIEIDNPSRKVILRRRSLYRTKILSVSYDEITAVRLGVDQVESGFALGGSTAAEKFPVPALRLMMASGVNVLLDRGSYRRLSELGKRIGERLAKPLSIDPELQSRSERG